MHQALYRKWRPQTFDDVCGQEHITSILKYETQNSKFSHAYLFCGSRGTGKTTCAKILSKAVNCESPVNGNPCNCCPSCMSIDAGTTTDVLEMDAASNNGVEHVRDIRDEIIYTPTSLKYRVYIVDEVHMLSISAFNALLKTLEEPPSHAVFILATTELHKLPATIVSRCQRYEFRRITTDVIVDRLATIANAEKLEYEADALRLIAKMAQGGMRDAISLLELCSGNRQKITSELVSDVLGIGGRDNAGKVVKAISMGDFESVFLTVEDIVRSSKDLTVFCQDLLSFYRDMLVLKTTSAAKKYLDLTEDEYEKLSAAMSAFTKETLLYHCRVLEETYLALLRAVSSKRVVFEMALVRMCDSSLDEKLDSVISRVSKLESDFALGTFAVPMRVLESNQPVQASQTVQTPQLDKSKAEIKQSVRTEPDVVKSVPQKSSLRALRGWTEVVEKAAAGNDSLLGFLKTSKAFDGGDGNIYIRFPNEFAMKMAFANAQIKANLLASLSILLKRSINDANVHYGVFEGNENDIEELDDLNI